MPPAWRFLSPRVAATTACGSSCRHAQRTWAEALIINPAAFTHYSYAIRDALLAIRVPAAEVHLSDVDARAGDFRKISVVRDVVRYRFKGLGVGSYLAALDAFASGAPPHA